MCPEGYGFKFDTSPVTHTAGKPSSMSPLTSRVNSPMLRTLTPSGIPAKLIRSAPFQMKMLRLVASPGQSALLAHRAATRPPGLPTQGATLAIRIHQEYSTAVHLRREVDRHSPAVSRGGHSKT